MKNRNFQEAKDFVLGLFLLLLIAVGYGFTMYLGVESPAHNTYGPQCIINTQTGAKECH